MQFRVLGPLQARMVRGDLATPSAAKPRMVLAMLLLHANQPMSAQRLADSLWPEEPPRSAHRAIATYISALRGALGLNRPGASVTLTSAPGGYCLRVPTGELDLLVFSDLAEQGEQAAAAGDHPIAADFLQGALALWRGRVVEDLDLHGDVTAAVAGYEERRLVVHETLIRTRLALRQEASVLAQLRALVAANPLREGMCGLLMQALYRTGRQAEALAVYTATRQLLIRELGVEPGPELRRTHLDILRQQQSQAEPLASQLTAAEPTHTPHPDAVVPRQLPALAPHFAGRAVECRELTAWMRAVPIGGTVVVTAVSGTAGVGKTALAVYWAHQVADQFPDGQLYVDLRGFDPAGDAMSAQEAMHSVLEALGVPPTRIPSGLNTQIGLYRSLIAGKRILILLDNARDTEQARPLLPGSPTAVAVVTSRNRLPALAALHGAHTLTLDLLTVEDAEELMARRLGGDRVTAEAEALHQIITFCARLPLALSIAAARAQEPALSLPALASKLRETEHRLDVLDAGEAATRMRAVLSWSYRILSPPAARLFRLLGIHPGPQVSTAAAASLAGQPLPETYCQLAELRRANLLVESPAERYGLHDLLRVYAAELARADEPDDHLQAATTRMIDHYTHSAYRADTVLNPSRDPIPLPLALPADGTRPEQFADHHQAISWLTVEQPVLLAALGHASGARLDTQAWQLAWALNTHLYRRGHWHHLAATWQVARPAADRIGTISVRAFTNRNLAQALAFLDQYDDAHQTYRRAMDLYALADDRTGQAHIHRHLGYLWERQGQLERALDHSQRALTLFRTAGHRHGQASALNSVGWQYGLLGDHTRALPYCEQALAAFQALDNDYGKAAAWDSLGLAHHHAGHLDRAADCYQRALTLFQDLGDRYDEATILTHLGDTQRAADNTPAAHRAWSQALHILVELNDPDAADVRDKLNRFGRGGTRTADVFAIDASASTRSHG